MNNLLKQFAYVQPDQRTFLILLFKILISNYNKKYHKKCIINNLSFTTEKDNKKVL
ncbi:MAG TPA: hypothetical protein VMV95_03850 [Bacillota bacterium]|nr:hypothetical protein [Bacillota bacterium]